MKTRTLGGALDVSAVGIGCMSMSEYYGPRDDAQSLETLRAALDAGVTLFDTSSSYGPHHNEELLAIFLRSVDRSAVQIATKFGNRRTDADPLRRTIDGSPEYVRASCDASLQRLGLDHVDLLYQHRIDRSVAIEETVGAMAELVHEGKVLHLGLSEATGDDLRRAVATHPIAALQSEWSLFTRDLEAGLVEVAAALGVSVVAYSPLGRGILSGQVASREDLAADDVRRRFPRFSEENLAANARQAELVGEIARSNGLSRAQVAIAWLLSRRHDVVPIPGTRSPARAVENAQAVEAVLSHDDVAALSAAFPPGSAVGDRYPTAVAP